MARVVPFDTFGWGPTDPLSLIPTRTTGTTVPTGSQLEWEAHELVSREVEPGACRSMARAGRPVSLLSDVAGPGKQDSPIYQRILRPQGLEHQLRAALRVEGRLWGFLHLERRGDQPNFSPSDVEAVEALVPYLADALRRWVLSEPHAPDSPRPRLPGVIVLDEDNQVDSVSEEAECWLREWGLADLKQPPTAIGAVVAAARARAKWGVQAIPNARVRLPSGAWLRVRATHLSRPHGPAGTAVVLEPASREEVAPLVAHANQLSPRETEVALLVLRGYSTKEIAAQLYVSAYTVQDHLKSIFDKVGVHSRRQLASEIFEPHFRAADPGLGADLPASRQRTQPSLLFDR